MYAPMTRRSPLVDKRRFTTRRISLQMGLSENNLPLNPIVCFHFPHHPLLLDKPKWTTVTGSLIIWVVIMNNPRLTWGYPNNPPQIPGLLWFPTMKNVTESSFREVNIPFYPHVLVTTTHYYCLNDKIFLYCQLHNVSGYIPWYSFTNSARPCRGGSFQNSNDDMKLYNGI
jgi:hypothetical protein